MPTRATAAAISTPWLMLGAHLRLDGMGRVWLWTYPGDLDGDPRCLGFTDDDRWHQWEAVCPDLGARPRWLDTEWNYLLDYWENR